MIEIKNLKGRHDGILGSLSLIKDLKKYNFDKVFIFNSSLRFNLIAKLSKIQKIFQYPLLKKLINILLIQQKILLKQN